MIAAPLISNLPLSRFMPRLGFKFDPGTELVGKDVLKCTENAVFTNDGRYFVAGKHADPVLGWGIYEVVRDGENFAVEQIIPGLQEINSTEQVYWFQGLTTDGTYLYAAGLVHLDGEFDKIDDGALFRILPSKDPVEVTSAPFHKDKGELRNYNGMAVGPDGSIYMSNSSALTDGSGVAVYKVTVTDTEAFEIEISPWLDANILRDFQPNGIQIRDKTMYYVSGRGMYQFAITPDRPGRPDLLYQTVIPTNGLDDLVVLPDQRVAVAEIDFITFAIADFTGLPCPSINQIVIVDPNRPLNREVILTSSYPVSSLAYKAGSLLANGNLIATSWVHGGVRAIDLP